MRGGFKSPPWGKIAFLVHFCDPIDPKKFDFSQISMTMPPIIFFWSQNGLKTGFYSISVDSGTKIPIWKCVFWAKMTKIGIQNPKLFVTNDYQQYLTHFEWFISLFQISDVKPELSPVKLKVSKNGIVWAKNLFQKIFLGYFCPPIKVMSKNWV